MATGCSVLKMYIKYSLFPRLRDHDGREAESWREPEVVTDDKEAMSSVNSRAFACIYELNSI